MSQSVNISIRPKGVPPKDLTLTPRRLRRLALHWDFLMRNRSRWIEDDDLRAKIAQRSRDHLKAIGVEETFLISMSRAGLVEVAQGGGLSADPDGAASQDTRRMPWESLLT